MTDETSSLLNSGEIPRASIPRNTVSVKPAPVLHDRITVVETISFVSMQGERIPPVESRYCRPVAHRDRPYQRTVTVTEEARPLDLGWAEEWPAVGLVHVSNEEGKRLQVIPTPAEKAELLKKVLEFGEWLVPPGETQRGRPKDVRSLTLRSQYGSIRVTVTIYPA